MSKKRIVNNAAWIIGCKIVQALLGMIVTMLSARYLGPSGYGLINYAAAIVAFVTPIMQLGLNSTLVQEVVIAPEREGETLGTAIAMNFICSFACIVGVISFVALVNRGERDTIIVCALYSTLLIFQSLETIQYWFQAKLLSKYTAVIALFAYVAVSIYKIVLLVSGRSIFWFALSQALDYGIIAIALLIVYRKVGTAKLSVSFMRSGQLFSRSKYYIVSSIMITVFAQTDRIMLKEMIDETAVGYYSAAVVCAGMTSFVFGAIIDSARPIILESRERSESEFENGMIMLYSIVIYLALAQSVVVSMASKQIVLLLYGDAYIPTVSALRIIVWYTTFSYLGAGRTVWILAEEKQRYLWIINLSGALLNVLLNAVLIPLYGINGAAIASLATQIFSNVVMGYIMKPIRGNNRLMLKALNPKVLICNVKGMAKNERKTTAKD